MSGNKSVTIHGVTLMEGDVVRIKFRKLEDILQDKRLYCRVNEVLDHYQIKNHLTAFCQGTGHFVVKEVRGSGRTQLSDSPGALRKRSSIQPPTNQALFEEISVEDHNDEDACWWTLNELLIEEITVENEAAESYFSPRHQLSLVRVNSTLYVNGAPLTTADSKIYEMFEKVMAEAAINRALGVDFGTDEKKDEMNF
jgi:hypothetical protein